jgi:hypothetical protein
VLPCLLALLPLLLRQQRAAPIHQAAQLLGQVRLGSEQLPELGQQQLGLPLGAQARRRIAGYCSPCTWCCCGCFRSC